MFGIPAPTPLDLHFSIFRTHVRVSPWFWLFSAVLGWGLVSGNGIPYLLLWILCVFLSILLHELGHVLTGRIFGSDGHIVLHMFGGLAVGSSDVRKRWQRIAVIFAGPGIQLVLWGLLKLFLNYIISHPELSVGRFLVSQTPVARMTTAALLFLLEINLFWPLLNLLPIWPLDGGQISRQLLSGAMPNRGALLALGISLGVSGLLAIHALLVVTKKSSPLEPLMPESGWVGMVAREILGFASDQFGILFFGILAVGSYFALQEEKASHSYPDDRAAWDKDRDDRDW